MQTKLIAGDSLSLLDTVDLCPASDGWTFKIRFVPQFTGTAITLTALADGDSFRTTAGSSVTASWATGRYSYSKWVEKEDERITVENGVIDIEANFSTLSLSTDTRSHLEKVVDAIELMLEGKATKDVQEYTIGDRQLKHIPLSELLVWRDKYKAQLAAERTSKSITKGLGLGRKIYVRL